MNTEDLRVDLARVQERIGQIDQASQKAHTRIDELNRDLRLEIKEILIELKAILEHVNKSKGWGSAAIWAVGILCAIFGFIVKALF